jgi:hypothetical protein
MSGLGIIVILGAVLRTEVHVVQVDILEINARVSDAWDEPDNFQIILWDYHPVLGRQCRGWHWVRQVHNPRWSEDGTKKTLSWYSEGVLCRIEYSVVRYTFTSQDPEVEERRLMEDTVWGANWAHLFE